MVYCPYHGAKHKGRIRKGVCIVSLLKNNGYFETFDNVMDYYNKEDVRKLGEKWSNDAVHNIIFHMDEQKKYKILRMVEK